MAENIEEGIINEGPTAMEETLNQDVVTEEEPVPVPEPYVVKEDIKSYIKFVDGSILPTYAVYSYKEYFQNAERDVFEIRMPDEDVTFEQIREIIDKPNNTDIITLIEAHIKTMSDGTVQTDSFEFQHGFYNIKMESSIRYIEDFCECFILKLARMTQEEQDRWNANYDIDEQQAAIVELAEIIAG